MSEKYYSGYDNEAVVEALVGNSVVEATADTLVLSNGTRLRFDTSASDCCTYLDLVSLATTSNIITSAAFDDDEGEYGEGEYKAWIHVITEAGELNIAEAEGNAGNGYYLHGFALGVTVISTEEATSV